MCEILKNIVMCMQTLPKLKFHDTHITIALLNVRSITAKLPDIAKDDGLKSASILCFCETWLTPSEPSPVVHDNHTNIRCDRASEASHCRICGTLGDLYNSASGCYLLTIR